MFTGLIVETGHLSGRTPNGPGARLRVACAMSGFSLGESVAVDGVCLTVDAITPGGFEADASAETLARTTLGAAELGAPLNLERALELGARLGGHLVTGHVDATGTLAERTPVGDSVAMAFAFPKELSRFIAEKGSVAVSGVSLTVNHVDEGRFSVMIIPHTLSKTSLGRLPIAGAVNLEVDLVARYVARWLEAEKGESSSSNTAWLDRLRRAGYM
jgi:riboflavin synthase